MRYFLSDWTRHAMIPIPLNATDEVPYWPYPPLHYSTFTLTRDIVAVPEFHGSSHRLLMYPDSAHFSLLMRFIGREGLLDTLTLYLPGVGVHWN